MIAIESREPAARADDHVNISVRVTREFRQWTDALADRSRLGRSTAIEIGLLLLAQANGFDVPPPRRS